MVLFSRTCRKNADGPKGQAFEASHEEAQVNSGVPNELLLSFKMSMVHSCQVSRSCTSFKFKFCSKSAHFFGALFQSDLALCFKSSQRTFSSINVCIYICTYIHRYIHTNSNVYTYIYVDQYIYKFSYTVCVRCPTHVYTHTYERLNTKIHQAEGVKESGNH